MNTHIKYESDKYGLQVAMIRFLVDFYMVVVGLEHTDAETLNGQIND